MVKVKRLSITALLIAWAVLWSVLPAAAVNSITDIQAQWADLQPVFAGYKYVEEPSVEAPYAPGALADGFLQDGLNMANFMRYLAGIPSDLVLDDQLSEEGQYGAVLLNASGFSHDPSKPADMSQSFYDIGHAATLSSNIYWNYDSLADSVVAYMDDSSPGNIAEVGHRRWILNPQMQKTGFGEANKYGLMWAVDQSRSATFPYDYVAWPNAGYAPNNFMTGYTPWSVSPNPSDYDRTATAAITVRLTRESDGYAWNFDAADTDTAGKYFQVDPAPGIGTNFCIIFRPDHVTAYEPGETYAVQISGLIDKSGNPREIAYQVEFFDIEAPAPDQEIRAFVTRFYQQCLGRDPDQAGLEYWAGQLARGDSTGAEVAYGFVYSSEFQAQDRTDEEYLGVLYRAFFGREPDSGGMAYWLGKMDSGTSRLGVLAGFVNAAEFGDLCNEYGITRGSLELPDEEVVAFVTRFYEECLGRAPDESGLYYWVTRLESGARTGADVAYGFVYSNEFQALDLTNAEYLQVLFNAFFGREPDSGGLAYWLDQMASGTSRLQVLAGFVNSNEFAALCADYGIVPGQIET